MIFVTVILTHADIHKGIENFLSLNSGNHWGFRNYGRMTRLFLNLLPNRRHGTMPDVSSNEIRIFFIKNKDTNLNKDYYNLLYFYAEKCGLSGCIHDLCEKNQSTKRGYFF